MADNDNDDVNVNDAPQSFLLALDEIMKPLEALQDAVNIVLHEEVSLGTISHEYAHAIMNRIAATATDILIGGVEVAQTTPEKFDEDAATTVAVQH